MTNPVIKIDISGDPGIRGRPAVMLAENAYCRECDTEHDMEVCPECGSWVSPYYGHALTGYGDHKICTGQGEFKFNYDFHGPCEWIWSDIKAHDEE